MSDNKDFFEKLAGIKEDDQEIEEEVEKELMKEASVSDDEEEDEEEEEEQKPQILDDSDDDALDFDDAEGHLTIDVYQDDKNIYIESAIAGIESDDIDVAITPESVTIKGKREKKEKVKKGDYLYQECFWGRFSRSVILPQEIDPDKSNASLKNGVLKVVLPKVSKTKSKRVKIKMD
ncbi:MAG: Hsp20/alpha crystallin family protein [Candidatus Paceibacterota bacterium]|jgi:HSP20 family protein